MSPRREKAKASLSPSTGSRSLPTRSTPTAWCAGRAKPAARTTSSRRCSALISSKGAMSATRPCSPTSPPRHGLDRDEHRRPPRLRRGSRGGARRDRGGAADRRHRRPDLHPRRPLRACRRAAGGGDRLGAEGNRRAPTGAGGRGRIDPSICKDHGERLGARSDPRCSGRIHAVRVPRGPGRLAKGPRRRRAGDFRRQPPHPLRLLAPCRARLFGGRAGSYSSGSSRIFRRAIRPTRSPKRASSFRSWTGRRWRSTSMPPSTCSRRTARLR